MPTTMHTLLVVDDEPEVVRSVQSLLRREFRVLGATSAADGMRLMQEHEVHLVMSDQRMPGMTGVEFLNQLRGDFPEAIRLLFTGYADVKAVIAAINEGNVYRYLAKPWDPDELRSVMTQAAEHYDLIVERKRLLAEVQARNLDLEAANAELRRAAELKAAFVRVASHEFCTPLTIVIGLGDLALRSPPDDARQRDWLARSQRAADRLKRLVDQMIRMLEAGRFDQVMDRRPLELAGVLGAAADDVRPFAELRHQELTCALEPGLGIVSADADKIRDAVGHLLLNAVKFTPDGGRIAVSAGRAADGRSTWIRVADNGRGIEPECLAHLFTPFFTGLDVSRHSSGTYEFGRQGIGLGLSIVKSFVELHGGQIEVVSAPGQGTTFTVALPTES